MVVNGSFVVIWNVLFQDEKNQIMKSNVWLRMVFVTINCWLLTYLITNLDIYVHSQLYSVLPKADV